MDVETLAILLVAGVILVLALAAAFAVFWFLVYSQFLASRLIYYTYEVVDPQVAIYASLLFAASADVVDFVSESINDFFTTIQNELIADLPLILGLLLLSFVAMTVTEYHEVGATIGMNIYHYFVRWIFYDLAAFKLVNLGRLTLHIAWPFVRFSARQFSYITRTSVTDVLTCSANTILGESGNIFSGLLSLAQSVATWIQTPSGIVAEPLPDFTAGYTLITTAIANILVQLGSCFCSQIDFIFNILFKWIGTDAFVSLLNHITQFGFAILRLVVRILTGTNPGTVPGVTANYGFIPNLDFVFTLVCEIVKDVIALLNAIIFLLVSEIVGKADPSLFQPGTPEAVVLAYDWLGFVGHVACYVIEAFRFAYRVLWSVVLVIVSAFAEAAQSFTVSDVDPPVPMFCDLREWRALYDFGGRTSIYLKPDGGIGGELQQALGHLGTLLDYASPIARKLVIPPLRIPITAIVGTLNFVARFLFHAIDSEFRQFSPAIPPRTGLPASPWIPPTPHPSAPLDCDGFVREPGYIWVWIQHVVDDPDNTLLIVVEVDLGEWSDGWDELGSLWEPSFGKFLRSIVRAAAYTLDFVVQSVAYLNVTFEVTANYPLFLSRWRYTRFFSTITGIGEGFGETLKAIHTTIPPNTACAGPEDGFFCALGDVITAYISLIQDVANQVVYVFTSATLQDFQMPNFVLAIDRLVNGTYAYVRLLSFAVPPIIINGTPLNELVAELLESAVFVLSLILYLPNYLVASFQPIVVGFKNGDTPSAIAVISGAWISNAIAYTFNEIEVRICGTTPNGILRAFAQVLDTFTGGNVWSSFANAICIIIGLLRVLVSDFAIGFIGQVFAVIGTFLDLLFGTGDIGTRVEAFISAIGSLIGFFFTQLGGFALQFLIGLVRAIFPDPIGEILATLLNLLATGLCAVLQGVFYLIQGIATIVCLGGTICQPVLVDLQCPGLKRDHFSGNMSDSPLLSIFETHRAALGPSLARLVQKFQAHSQKRSLQDATGPGAAYTHFFQNQTLNMTAFSAYYGDPDAYILAHNLSATTLPPTLKHLTVEEAVLEMGAFFEWDGYSTCDELVRHVSTNRIDYHTMSFTDQLTLRDCYVSRSTGEFLSVLPGLQWFPVDGLYNKLSWVTLSIDALKAYQIYSQYTSDRNQPIEYVLSGNYSKHWSSIGLRVDHLRPDNYRHMIYNMTIRDYFERNDGRYEFVQGLSDFGNFSATSAFSLAEMFDQMSESVLHSNGTLDYVSRKPSSLETWFYGDNYTVDGADISDPTSVELPPALAFSQEITRTTIFTVKSIFSGAKQIYTTSQEVDLYNKTVAALNTVPGLVNSGLNWALSPADQAWLDAVKARDINMAAHGFHSPIWGEVRPGTLWSQFWAWSKGRMTAALSHLKPNDLRAQRNWSVVLQLFVDIQNAYRSEYLTTVRQEGRRYTPHHVTGEYAISPTSNQPVAVLAECNTTLVPFCLDCAVLDGLIEQLVIGGIEFTEYWDTLWVVSYNRYLETDAYISDPTVMVCGGDGTKPIQWPSAVVVSGSTTLIDILGGPAGAVGGLVNFAMELFNNEIGTLENARSILYRKTRQMFNLDGSERLAQKALSGKVVRRATVNYITDYATTYTEFDPTYSLTEFFDITPITMVLDDTANYFGGISFVFSNTTLAIPQLTPTLGDSDGFFGELVQDLVNRDYSHTCADRNMTLGQGVILFTILAVVAFFVILSLRACIPESVMTMIAALGVGMIVAIFFFVVVYGVPVQNLLGIPVWPQCFPDDSMDLLVCDLIPKCPAIVSGLVIGDYTEANCYQRPFELPLGNCKRNFDVRHPLDVFVLIIEWLSRPFANVIRNPSGLGLILTPALGVIGVDLFRFETLDFSVNKIFDRSFICILIIGVSGLPMLLLGRRVAALVITPIAKLGVGVATRIAKIAWLGFLTLSSIYHTFSSNLIFLVTPEDREDLRSAEFSQRRLALAGVARRQPGAADFFEQDPLQEEDDASFSDRLASNAKHWVTRMDRRYGFSDLWTGARDTTGQLRHRSRKHRHRHRNDDDESGSRRTRPRKHRREPRKDL